MRRTSFYIFECRRTFYETVDFISVVIFAFEMQIINVNRENFCNFYDFISEFLTKEFYILVAERSFFVIRALITVIFAVPVRSRHILFLKIVVLCSVLIKTLRNGFIRIVIHKTRQKTEHYKCYRRQKQRENKSERFSLDAACSYLESMLEFKL